MATLVNLAYTAYVMDRDDADRAEAATRYRRITDLVPSTDVYPSHA
ncbi:MAG: hypothetical protein R2705_21265 [Ilumatobacteraceae bacterium]